MDLYLIVGPQAVGKMTVGLELEKKLDAKLLFNHQTIDLFADFLGYTSETFRLSDQTRKSLFDAFVKSPETNVTNGIIFTVVIGFDIDGDWDILNNWIEPFLNEGGKVYLIELEADLEERLKRNIGESRLKAKPSKRDLEFSKKELLHTAEKHRLNSYEGEVEQRLPKVHYLKVNNNMLEASKVAEQIKGWIDDSLERE